VETIASWKTDGGIPSREPSNCLGDMERSNAVVDETKQPAASVVEVGEMVGIRVRITEARVPGPWWMPSVIGAGVFDLLPAGPSSNAAGAKRLEVTLPRLSDWSRSHCAPGRATRFEKAGLQAARRCQPESCLCR
jgi:hypothetical protein